MLKIAFHIEVELIACGDTLCFYAVAASSEARRGGQASADLGLDHACRGLLSGQHRGSRTDSRCRSKAMQSTCWRRCRNRYIQTTGAII